MARHSQCVHAWPAEPAVPAVAVQAVPAGNVLAIAGLDMAILKSATVASSPLCRPLAPMLFQSAPIVRVAGEAAGWSGCGSGCGWVDGGGEVWMSVVPVGGIRQKSPA